MNKIWVVMYSNVDNEYEYIREFHSAYRTEAAAQLAADKLNEEGDKFYSVYAETLIG